MPEISDRLLEVMDSRAADLDSSGPLAPSWVSALTLEELDLAFGVLIEDRDCVMRHRRSGPACGFDGQSWPCRTVKDLVDRYLG
jgi:hypothetical protein